MVEQPGLNMKHMKLACLLVFAAALVSCGPPLEGPDPLDRGDLDSGGMPIVPDPNYPDYQRR